MKRITKIRLEKKVSINKLSKLSGVTSHTIKKFENGNEILNSEVIKIATALGVKSKTISLINSQGQILAREKRFGKRS